MTDITKLPKWAQVWISELQDDFGRAMNMCAEKSSHIDDLEAQLKRKKSVERIADLDQRILSQVNKALGGAITNELTGYGKPLSKIVERVIGAHDDEIYNLVNDEFVTFLAADDFRVTLKEALNAKLARVLISRMGGELEKRVNELKSNPQTRALITLAVSGAMAELAQGEKS